MSSEQLAEGRRRQKVYEDILGRTYKSETLNWDGSVYSTSKSFFNGRDQVTLARQYAGADSSSTFQDTTATYDGYGRLKTNHRPEQNTGTATTYNYFNDDRIQQIVDARGAAVNYTYDNRGLTTQVSTTSPNTSTIPVTPTVSYSYDNLGNRTSMTDGLGTQTYEYNQLSQLMAETRSFNDSLPNAPMANNSFRLEYSYSISGQLKSITDAYGQQINYTQDKIGRLNQVTGSIAFGGVTSYANNPNYRAWGAIKNLSYGDNNAQMSVSYDNRLLASSFLLTKDSTNQIKKDYQYLLTGEVSFIDDTLNIGSGTLDDSNRFDRSFKFDHLGRTTQTRTGAEATGGTDTPDKIPYSENFTYDAFGHTTSIQGMLWDTWNDALYTPNYVNNRAANRYYDAEGNEKLGAQQYTYNASGEMILSTGEFVENVQYLDGDGAELKRVRRIRPGEEENWSTPNVSYFIKSTVMGKLINEVKSNGSKDRAYVYGGERLLAKQFYDGTTETVQWEISDASGMSLQYQRTNTALNKVELNGMGNDVGVEKPLMIPPPKNVNSPTDNISAFAVQNSGGCVVDGIEQDCSKMTNDSAVRCPDNDCGPRLAIWKSGKITVTFGFGRDPKTGKYGFSVPIWDRTSLTVDGQTTYFKEEIIGEHFVDCDMKLAEIFGGVNSVVAGNNFEPKNLIHRGAINVKGKLVVTYDLAGQYRGKGDGADAHLDNALHLYYGDSNGGQVGQFGGDAYIPAGGEFKGRNPLVNKDQGSYLFFYKKLGNLKNVYLTASHIQNFIAPKGITKEKTKIGEIGGDGGFTEYTPDLHEERLDVQGKYLHSHYSIFSQGKDKRTGKLIPILPRHSFAETFCK